MSLWDDREDFRPLGHRLQRVDQEAYCDKVQPRVRRLVRGAKPVGEQADYELDRILAGPVWDHDTADWNDMPACVAGYGRLWKPGYSAPVAPPVLLTDFPDLTAPVLEAVPARQMELLEWTP